MIPVLLLARNFVRQNHWLLIAFILWPFMLAAFAWSPHHPASREDAADNVRVEVFYGLAVIAFLAGSGIYNEKRSRRIVGVLSKSVSRLQYLLGLWAGGGCFAALYFAMVGASVIWLLRYSQSIVAFGVALLLHGVIASLWVSAAALLFSTFLHPLVAATLAGAWAFAPLLLANPNPVLAPVGAVLLDIDSFGSNIHVRGVTSAIAQFVLFLFVAAKIFAHRDVTVSIE